MLTHRHGDHVGSAAEILRRAPGASGYAGAEEIGSISVPRPLKTVAQGDKVFLAIAPCVARAGERRVQQTEITYAPSTAMFGKLFVVHDQYGLDAKPLGLGCHFANSRRALR